jgi:hypothetical protein
MAKLDPAFEKKARAKEAKRVRETAGTRVGRRFTESGAALRQAVRSRAEDFNTPEANRVLAYKGPQGDVPLRKDPLPPRETTLAKTATENIIMSQGQVTAQPRVGVEQPPAQEAAIDPTSGEALRDTFLGQQGVNAAAQGQAGLTGQARRDAIQGKSTLGIRTSDAFKPLQERIGNATPQAQLGQELLANTQDTKFTFGAHEGGATIFGRASEPGGRINTFTGAGLATPGDPTTQIDGDRAARLGGRLQEGFQSTAVNPELQAGIDAFKLRAASGGNLRAGDQQFRGGAASGGGDATLRQINRINSRADKAFQDALSQGMNTKAAARMADSIRDSASQINFQDRTRAGERQTSARIEGRASDAALRNQGEMSRLHSTQAREDAQAQIQLVRDTFVKDTLDADGNVIGQENDSRAFAKAALQVGGEANLGRVSSQTANRLASRGEAITGILDNVNKLFKDKGSNQKFNNVADLVRGSKVQGKVSQTPVDFMDVIRSGNVDIFDIRKDKVTIGDELITVEDFFGGEQFDAEDLAAFVEMAEVAEDNENE